MATHLQKHVTGIPIISSVGMNGNSTNWITSTQKGDHSAGRADSTLKRMNGTGRNSDVLASVQEHVRLSPKLTEAVKGKLSLGARILQVGGMEKAFKLLFGVSKKESLIKASWCYLSTTAGPIAGFLFASKEKVAYCSERSTKVCCPPGEPIRIKYKVAIPLSKTETANQSENMERPTQKYIQIITMDGFLVLADGIFKPSEDIQVPPGGDFLSTDGRQRNRSREYMENTPQVVEIAKRIL